MFQEASKLSAPTNSIGLLTSFKLCQDPEKISYNEDISLIDPITKGDETEEDSLVNNDGITINLQQPISND